MRRALWLVTLLSASYFGMLTVPATSFSGVAIVQSRSSVVSANRLAFACNSMPTPC